MAVTLDILPTHDAQFFVSLAGAFFLFSRKRLSFSNERGTRITHQKLEGGIISYVNRVSIMASSAAACRYAAAPHNVSFDEFLYCVEIAYDEKKNSSNHGNVIFKEKCSSFI